MTAEKGANNCEKRKVLVGITFDSQGRELISWAIVKVADSGDQVVAVHVCRKADDATKEKVALDCFLESYRGLCDIKKVNLHGQILRGSSIRKSLVKEAKACHASAVVVGTSKQTTLGGWLSASKYCAKHLDSRIEVVSIHNGKVVFRRSSNDQIAVAQGRDPKPSFLKLEHLVSGDEDDGDSTERKLSLVPNKNTNTNTNTNTHSRSCGFSMESNLEIKAGWPLLRTSSMPTYSGLEARKMSVVQWVMNLPSRSSPETTQIGSSEFSFSVSESTLADSRRTSHSFWGEIAEDSGLPGDLMHSNFTWFSYEVLKSSTSHFSSGNVIGKGGCSRVYKGRFPDGRPVAVKVTKSSRAGWKDFSLEIDIISSLKHKNLTSLLGVCIENSELISVHEFMSKGSLEDTLHNKSGDPNVQQVLHWEARFKIAVGIADALNYIHNGCSRPVIHRDVKSSNILLSERFEPKLSDFGLAVWGPMNSSYETYDDVVGTFGYLAPEYFMYGKVSTKVDVYSFGVVLLELLSGRKSIDTSKGQESLVMWAEPILESRKPREIVDPDLEGSFDEIQMQRMMVAASLCLTRSARLRPYMNQIVRLLKGEESIEKWNKSCKHGMEVNDDEVYVDTSRKSHLSLALVDVEDDLTSMSSTSW